jgi:hypothetical protein
MGEALSYNEPEGNGDDSPDAFQKLSSHPADKQIGQVFKLSRVTGYTHRSLLNLEYQGEI